MDSLLQFIMNFSGPTPYILVFILLMLCGLGLPLPEDVILFSAGLMVYYGVGHIWIMIIVGFFGVMVGDSFVFSMGAFFGRRIRKHWLVKKILPLKRQRIVRKKLHKEGKKVIFFARFMPGLRTPIYFTSGTMHLPFRDFIIFDGAAAMISVPALVYVVYHFGYEVDYVIKIIRRVQFGIVATIVTFVIFLGLKIYWTQKREKDFEDS